MEKAGNKCSLINANEILYPADDITIRYFYPAADLSCFIKYYWMIQIRDTAKFNKLSQISPSGYPELIFHFGDEVSVCTSVGNSPKASSDTIIAGQITQSVYLHFHNHINSLCVKLQPYALNALFKIKSSEFTNRATSLNDINPNLQKDIYNQLSEAHTDSIRIMIVEGHLRSLLKKNHNSIDPFTCAAINHLKTNIGRNVRGFEQIMDISSRTVQRRIMEGIGVSPKILKRIIRFNKAYHLLRHYKDLNLQDVSFCLGYYDLSHLINEFKEFTGSSPAGYFKKEDVYNSLFAGIM